MWNEIYKELAGFPNAVLTGVDAHGFPFSLRCTPLPDQFNGNFVVQMDGWTEMQPGPAGLLCHRHDEHLDHLKSFIVIGNLDRVHDCWVFIPKRWVKGAGYDGLLGFVRFVLDGRQSANQYLKKRNLPRPKVQWDIINKMWAEIRAGQL